MSRFLIAGRLLLPVGLLTVSAALSGCGGPDRAEPARTVTQTTEAPEETTSTTGEPTQRESPSDPGTAEAPATADAAATVRRYFAALNAEEYRRAWELGGKNLSDSYSGYVEGFAETEHNGVEVLESDGGVVSVRLEAVQSDGSRRDFRGTYTVRDGRITGADIREVSAPRPEHSGPSPYYKNCDAAREAGVAPLHKGDPGYAEHLDRDRDGVACEPYPP